MSTPVAPPNPKPGFVMTHYHADTADLPWPGPLDADCHAGLGLDGPAVSPWVARALEQRGTLRGGLPAPTLAPVRRAK